MIPKSRRSIRRSEKTIKGMNPNAFQILQSIPGVGPVFAAGILAEIGDISAFHSDDALAKYATKVSHGGIVTPETFVSEETPVFRAGNTYLRYFIGGEQRTVLAVISLNMGITMRKSSLKFQNINYKEHSRLHHVNSYDSFFWFAGQKPTVHRRKIGRRTE